MWLGNFDCSSLAFFMGIDLKHDKKSCMRKNWIPIAPNRSKKWNHQEYVSGEVEKTTKKPGYLDV